MIAGMMVIGFIATTDFDKTYSGFFKEKRPEFRKVDIEGFVSDAVVFWKDCGLGERNSSLILYVNGEGQINRTVIFNLVKKVNLCNTLQSAEEECGMGEHLDLPAPIELPRVVNLRCDSSTGKLIIS